MKSVLKILILASLLIPALASARHRKSAFTEIIDSASVKAPVDQEVCFSPEEPCDIKLEKFVDTAQKSIDVAIYDLNLEELVHKLVVASKKIQVRILVDKRQAKGEHSLVPLLEKAGAEVRYGRQRGIMHNKFLIVDGKMVEAGSFNYTHHASQSNNENQIYLANPSVVSRYLKRFEEIWRKGTPTNKEAALGVSPFRFHAERKFGSN